MTSTERGHWMSGVLVLAFLAAVGQTQGSTNTTVWQHDPASTGCWMVQDNWTQGVPAENTTAFIMNGGTALVHDDGAVAERLFLGGRRNGAVEQTGGSLTLGRGLWLGYGRAGGYYDLSGGTFATTNAFIGSGILANVIPWRPSRFRQSGGTSVFEGTVHVGLMPWAVPALADVAEADSSTEPDDTPMPPYHSARLELTDGELSAGRIRVGYAGRGDVVQTGGAAKIAGGLHLGGRMVRVAAHRPDAAAAELIVRPYGGGTYRLSEGTLAAGSVHVGDRGDGRFVQTGGGVEVETVLRLGGRSWRLQEPEAEDVLAPEVMPDRPRPDSGAYALIDGRLKTERTDVGLMGYGLFTQSGGTHRTGALRIGMLQHWPPILDPAADVPDAIYPAPIRGRYVLRGGELHASLIELGGVPRMELMPADLVATVQPDDNLTRLSTLLQRDGSVETESLRVLGGTYEMFGGKLWAATASLAHPNSFLASSRFVQRGGSVSVDGLLNIGTPWPAPGPEDPVIAPEVYLGTQVYSLLGGELSASAVRVGGADRAMLVQTGGSLEAKQIYLTGRSGVYNALGGRVRAGAVYVGATVTPHDVPHYPNEGTLRLGPRAAVAVTDRLVFGRTGQFRADEGSAIHMDGAHFANCSTDSNAVGGLDDLTMVFTADPTGFNPWQTYEVAGKDLGFVPGGWIENFVIDTLQLGNAAVPGYVRLVDEFDNQPDYADAEALYLRHLIIGPGSRLDLNGLNIYYIDLEIGDGAEIFDGTVTGWDGAGPGVGLVPEPATLMILGLGALVSLVRRRR